MALSRSMLTLAAGTQLPEDLIIVHERADHYSLQPSREMTLAGELYGDRLLDLSFTFDIQNSTERSPISLKLSLNA